MPTGVLYCMRMNHFLHGVWIVLVLGLAGCFENGHSSKQAIQQEVDTAAFEHLPTAYFAGGCFWCVEAIFERVKGVREVVSGYAGGAEKNPTYQQVSSGQTGHAESVKVYYDPEVVSYPTLVKVFFASHDPTTLNRQGPDRGPQYRSAIFYQNPTELAVIRDYIGQLQADGEYADPITTEVAPLDQFYAAEAYHQNYERNHPQHPYIQNVSLPRLRRFQTQFPELLKASDPADSAE